MKASQRSFGTWLIVLINFSLNENLLEYPLEFVVHPTESSDIWCILSEDPVTYGVHHGKIQ
jgi:hypothetical protein